MKIVKTCRPRSAVKTAATTAVTAALFGLAPLALPATPAAAAVPAEARTGAVMTLAINKSQTLRVERAIGKAAIGNEKIADVVPVSQSSVYVLGKGLGSTNLSLYDRSGGLIAVVDIVVTPDAQSLKAKLAELLPAEQIGVTVSNNSVVLEGKVSSPAAVDRAVRIAETYAPKSVINMMSVGLAQQVLLEVRFAEMSRNTVKQLGITGVSWGDSVSNGLITGAGNLVGGITGTFGFPLSNLTIQMNALEQQGLIRTLAQPNLIALSGENAYFLAGGEFPIPTGVALNGQVSIEFKQFGVSLTFTPTVLEDGLINLLVAPEVSQLDASAGIDLNGIRIPGLKVRRAKTMLEMRDGQSFAIAGLIQSDFTDTVAQVPLLGRIPIIGTLFRSTSFTKNESELVMIVTPRLVRPVPAGSFTTPTDRVQVPSDFDLFLNGRTEKRLPVGSLPGGTAGTPVAAGGAAVPAAATNPVGKPGGIDGEFGHIVR